MKESKDKPFVGKCEKCSLVGEVRYLKQYKPFQSFSQEIEQIGPFDKYCAYRIKFNDPPFFETQPQSVLETIYRYLVREEIPYGEKKQYIMKSEILNKLKSFVPILIVYSVIAFLFLIILFPIFVFIAPLYFLLLPLILVQATIIGIFGIRRFVDMLSKHPGTTKNENFEKFWDGIIVRQDKSLSYYLRLILSYIIILPNVIYLYRIEPLFTKLITGEIYQLYQVIFPFDPLNVVWGIRLYHIIVILIIGCIGLQINSLRILMPWDSVTAMPEDVYELAKNRHKTRRKEKSKLLEEQPQPSRNPFLFITKRILSNSTVGMFTCQICKGEVYEYEKRVFCDNCSRYFHEDHLKTYFRNLEKDALSLVCPVCYYDAHEVFTEINWKANIGL